MRGALVLVLVLVLVSLACSKTANVVESRPLTVDFATYATGSVEVEPKGIEGGEEASQDMLAYLESKLKQDGVLEPMTLEKGAQLIVRVRAAAHNEADQDFRVLVDFVDARSRATVGQVTVAGTAPDDKTAALHRIADEIVAYMRANRRGAATAKDRGTIAPAPVPVPASASDQPPPGAVTNGACTTTCTPDTSSALPPDDQKRIAEKLGPMLAAVRGCLDRVSAQSIHPAAILRFEVAGQLSKLTIDAGGYDDLACIADARSRPPLLRVTRASSVRCEYRCQ